MKPKIDNLDKKILAELDCSSKIPVTKLAKKLNISREVAKYHLRKLIDSGVIKSFTTMINPAKFGFIIYKIYLKLQNLSVDKEKELLEYLKKDGKVFWLAKTEGSYDIIAGVYVKNIVEFDIFLSVFIEKFGKIIASRHISNSVYAIPFPKKYLAGKPLDHTDKLWGGVPEKESLDDMMISILKLIAEDSRRSIVDLSQKLHTSPKTIISKLRFMEKENVIIGYKTLLDLEKISKENFKAIICFHNLTVEKENQFKEFCKLNPYIVYFIKTIGEWDVELDIEVDNLKEFNRLVKDMRMRFGDIIKRIESVYISEEPKGELNIVRNI